MPKSLTRKGDGAMWSGKRKQVARQVISWRTHEQWRGAAIAAAATRLQSCRQTYSTYSTRSRRARRDQREEAEIES
eukprot:1099645-Pleurochrysis_carterae.AAC.1